MNKENSATIDGEPGSERIRQRRVVVLEELSVVIDTSMYLVSLVFPQPQEHGNLDQDVWICEGRQGVELPSTSKVTE